MKKMIILVSIFKLVICKLYELDYGVNVEFSLEHIYVWTGYEG